MRRRTIKPYLCSIAAPGVEVVTVHDTFSGQYVTTINGGRLDGEKLKSVDGSADAKEQHLRVCQYVREPRRALASAVGYCL